MVWKGVTRRGIKNETNLTVSDIRTAGQKAWAIGLPLDANPHPPNTRLSGWWSEGWHMAMRAAVGDAWELGEEAFRNGRTLDDNPFPAGEPSAHRIWREGWQSGQDGHIDNLPRGKRR
jgi:hypothetical protein